MGEFDIHEHLPWDRPRPKWRRRLLFGSLIIVPLCLAILYGYFVYSSNQELLEAFAEADQLDPGWRVLELEQKRAIIPDVENSGLVLIAAKKLMPANWPFWDFPQAPENRTRPEEDLRTLQERLGDLEPPVQLDEQQIQALREELQRAQKALGALRKVADLPGGRYPINYTKDCISTLLPHVQDARFMANLLGYDALLRAQDGDMDGALTSCQGVLNCGRSIGDEPTLISMLVRIASTKVAMKKVERTLAQGEPLEAALSRLQREFEAEAEQPLFLIGARGERSMIDGAMQAIQTGDLDPRFLYAIGHRSGGALPFGSTEFFRVPGMTKSIQAALLKHHNRFVEIAKLPVEQQGERIQELQAAEQDLPELARPILAAALNVSVAFTGNQAELRCAVVMVAVERYRRANNRWPDALTDLVPAFLPKVPLDPFDGSPLRYRRLSDGVVIYSVGPDGKDNGGKLDKDPKKEGTDLGLRLWDVPQRRQLPKPPDKNADESS